jgi:hypothetical protein
LKLAKPGTAPGFSIFRFCDFPGRENYFQENFYAAAVRIAPGYPGLLGQKKQRVTKRCLLSRGAELEIS